MLQTIRRHQTRRNINQRGFTLIELLVVIIILGILAAVVVFAVGGAGDKGRASARAIDMRTIKTAQEAFCAQFGRYADGEELVTAGFLSEIPVYHQTGPAVSGGAGTVGNCRGAGDLAKSGYVVTCDSAQEGCGEDGALELSWTVRQTSTTQLLNDVRFVDARTGWAVGRQGAIQKTTDGGETWSTQPATPPTSSDLWAVDCVSVSHCWAVGADDIILATTNGGDLWTHQTGNISPAAPFSGARKFGIDCIDTMTCFAADENGFGFKTTDGGASWTPQDTSGGNFDTLRGVNFIDGQRGWIGGFNQVWRTVDGGVNWVPVVTPGFSGIYSVRFINAQQGWAAGPSGPFNLFRTTDGGATWTELPIVNGDREDIDFVDGRHGWSVGLNPATGPVVFTTDGGLTWNLQSVPPGNGASSVDFVDLAHGWAGSGGGKVLVYGP